MLGPAGGLRLDLWEHFELILTDTLGSKDSAFVSLSLQMFPKHHRTEDAAVGGAGGRREEGVCLKHLRKAEDPILVMLGLNPVGRGTGQGCTKYVVGSCH